MKTSKNNQGKNNQGKNNQGKTRQDKTRLGADIGGTFTDVVLEHKQQHYSAKVLTTYAAPEIAIIDGMHQVCELAGIEAGRIDQIIHGTTLATNALIERKGAKTALVTTKGFRDVIEMRSESRFEQYDLNLELPPPLLSRKHRYTLEERVGANGEVYLPLARSQVEDLVDDLLESGYESVAVGFMHAYANFEHEQMVAEVLAEKAPHMMVSLSSEVSPQMREYERFNTVVANAYIKPLMKNYLQRLASALGGEGVSCPIFLMHSGGGIISLENAAEFPVRLVESGPAGGAVFAANVAARYGLEKTLSFDMGGTTAKICLINNHTPKTSRVFEVARSYRFKKGSGMPISIPVIDMVEIGAGGGSIAHVDALQQIRVGPESAGSEPGPACYGRGGSRPTVTDADLVLGRLDPKNFAGGSIELDSGKSAKSLQKHLGNVLEMDPETAAYGLAEVVDENMANAARVHAVENGEDLSDYTMIAFGGAAPLHASRLCQKLGIDRLLIPAGAGVGSAIGFLQAPFSFEANRSQFTALSAFDAEAIAELLRELKNEAVDFVRSCDATAEIECEYKVYMRYAGQGWEIPVILQAEQALNPNPEIIQQLFERAYEQLFGRVVSGAEVEITVWSVNATTTREKIATVKGVAKKESAMADKVRRIFDPASEKLLDAAEVLREAMQPGMSVTGPAAIIEDETTIIIPDSSEALMQADGTIDVQIKKQNSAGSFSSRSNDVRHQVMWNRLISVVEEQAQALIRTAFSTSVREAGDLSAGVYDPDGNMLAQAVTGTPGHVNAMADSLAHFIRRIGRDNILAGDVYITNDPWEGTGHLHDLTVMTPSFYQGELIGFFGCTAHVVDIGGRGFSADAASVYEEGLYIPIMKMVDQGEVNDTLISMVRGNVREPDQVVGDIFALASCNSIGDQRLQEMLTELQIVDLQGIATFILEHSRRATQEAIAALPNGTAAAEMTIDGYSKPITLKVSLEIQDDQILCDFTGSSGVDKNGINVPLVYTQAYACYALKCAIAPAIPNNAASLAPFIITAPENSILNAKHPAPVALRHVIGHMLPDTVYGALDKLLPNCVPVEGAGALCNFQLSLRPRSDIEPRPEGEPAEVLTFNSGGSGARPTLDGMNATAFPSGVMTMPVEATEHTGPVIIWRKELRPDSGGAGKFRGGLGQYMEIGARDGYEFDFSAMFDRVDHPARGRHGGTDGAPTTLRYNDDAPLQGKGKQFVAHDQRVKLAFPGGAGYGKPRDRNRDAVANDLQHGYISAQHARDFYAWSDAEISQVLGNSIQNKKES